MDCLKMITVKHNGVAHTVPCGRCAFCLTNKRSSWMFRIYHEMKRQATPDWKLSVNPGYFLTLTYAEHMVPRLDDGRLTLRFRHIQWFFKKIRKHGFKCKYICVGEYGGVTERPHYHVILWTDLPSHRFEEFWSNRTWKNRGRVHVGTLTMASAMYCLKYIIQPKVKSDGWVDPDGTVHEHREKTRAQFSHGIGLSYMTTPVYEWHNQDEDEPILWSYIDGKKVALPRYYKSKIFTKYSLSQERVKLVDRKEREFQKELQALRDRGIADPEKYRQRIRVDQANAIVAKSKKGQSI